MTGTHGARVRGNLEQLLQQSAAVVRGSASLPALITARIDRLRPSQQLTLKARRLRPWLCASLSHLQEAAMLLGAQFCVTTQLADIEMWMASMMLHASCDTKLASGGV